MLTSRELVPLALAVTLIGGVGALAVQTRQERAEREARERNRAVLLAGEAAADADWEARRGRRTAPVEPSELGAVPLREVDLPAPSRDPRAIRQVLSLRSEGTYIEDMLAEDPVLVRWPDRTVAALRVWVQPRTELEHWSDRYPQMVRDVFPEWTEAGFPMRFQHLADSADADLHVLFTTSLTGRQIGVTNRLRDEHGWIVGATIVIATQDEAGAALPAALVAGIARHEVGHALGLGHARDTATVMFPESKTTTISARDRATLTLLYTLPPGPVPPAP